MRTSAARSGFALAVRSTAAAGSGCWLPSSLAWATKAEEKTMKIGRLTAAKASASKASVKCYVLFSPVAVVSSRGIMHKPGESDLL